MDKAFQDSIDRILSESSNRISLKYLVELCRSGKDVIPVYDLESFDLAGVPPAFGFGAGLEPGSIEFLDEAEGRYGLATTEEQTVFAHALMAKLGRRLVVSGGLDPTAETVAAMINRPFMEVVVGPGSQAYVSPRTLIRLHGSAAARIVVLPADTLANATAASWILDTVLKDASIFGFGVPPDWPPMFDRLLASEAIHYFVVVGSDDVRQRRGGTDRLSNVRLIRLKDKAEALPLLIYLHEQVFGAIEPGMAPAKPHTAPAPQSVPAQPKGPLPGAFPELVERCRAGETFLLTGSGLAARAGLPTWRQFVGELVEIALRNKSITEASAAIQRSAIEDGETNAVADNLSSALGNSRQEVVSYLESISGRVETLPLAFGYLKRTNFAAVLSTNFDELLDRAYADTPYGEHTYVPSDSAALHSALAQRQRFILKLYGSLRRPESLIFAPAEYEAMIAGDRDFSKFIEAIFYDRTMLIVGASLEGITDFLRGFRIPTGVPRKHYALVGVSGTSWKARAETLLRRYNIEVIPYTPDEPHSAVDAFLKELATVAPATTHVAAASAKDDSSRLRGLTLRNIGPFDELSIEMTGNWLILLGDNAVGKSSILKAIALAIVGDEGRSYAGRLVRANRKNGSVVLITDRNQSGYQTDIFGTLETQHAEVASRSGRALEIENWVALGFPPMRTGSWATSPGPVSGGVDRPVASDILPLLTGEPDPRMDKLKQWIVNYDVERRKKGPGSMEAKALDTFFSIVGNLTGELNLSFAEVDLQYRVLVRVNQDDPIPIEAISQGLTSLLSWIGILVQRLYEIRGANNEHPTNLHALVLMDEIDAHMHPKWQRRLVSLLSECFPNVQFIASTHSPLIVAGLSGHQVLRLKRNESGQVVCSFLTDRDLKGKPDQILLEDGFELPSVFSASTEKIIEKYERYLGMSTRTEEEEAEYLRLRRLVQEEIPPHSDGRDERLNRELLEAVIEAIPSPQEQSDSQKKLMVLAHKLNAGALQ
ncbi:MAG: hypothetical protein FJW32_15310 [Acidobacteria bacterium]|nr:hypothetical protein [Acidobacteriota bacterium]